MFLISTTAIIHFLPRYDSQGKYLGSLPDLGTARYTHACATFVSSDGEEVGA